MNSALIGHLADMFRKGEGSDVWWKIPDLELFPLEVVSPHCEGFGDGY